MIDERIERCCSQKGLLDVCFQRGIEDPTDAVASDKYFPTLTTGIEQGHTLADVGAIDLPQHGCPMQRGQIRATAYIDEHSRAIDVEPVRVGEPSTIRNRIHC